MGSKFSDRKPVVHDLSGAPSRDDIAELAHEHRFPESFDLTGELEDAWLWWHADKAIKEANSVVDHRKFLRATENCARRLEDLLEKMGTRERSAILEAIDDSERIGLEKALGSRFLEFEPLALQLRVLAAASQLASQKPAKRGRPKNKPTWLLISKLYRINCCAFGEDAARISKSGDYQGRFFDFCHDVLKLFGTSMDNSALGHAIERAIKEVDSKDKSQ